MGVGFSPLAGSFILIFAKYSKIITLFPIIFQQLFSIFPLLVPAILTNKEIERIEVACSWGPGLCPIHHFAIPTAREL